MSQQIETKRSICTMCGLNCGILVYVTGGRIVKIAGNPDNPISRGFVCKRIASAIQWLYHPDQLKYPLKRVGKRGEGKWQRVGWDDALGEIGQKLLQLKKDYGPETLGFFEGTYRG